MNFKLPITNGRSTTHHPLPRCTFRSQRPHFFAYGNNHRLANVTTFIQAAGKMENMVYDLTWLEAPLPPLPRSSALQKNRIRTVDDGGGVSREGGGGDGLFHGVTKMGGIERGRSDDGGNFGCLLCGLTQDNGLCLHCSLHGKGKGFFFLQAMCGGGGPFYSPLPRYFHPRLPRKRKKVMQVCWGGDTHS